MKDATKMGLGALGMVLFSILCVYLIAFSNQINDPVAVAGAVAIVVAIIVFVAGIGTGTSAVAGVAGAITVVAVVAVAITVGAAVAVVAATIAVGAAITWDKEEKDVYPLPFFLLMIVFILPFIPGTYFCSHFHNENQLVRDQKVAEILEVRKQGEGIEVKLPPEYAKEHRYLRAVLSFHFGSPFEEKENAEIKRYSWREKEICCQEGSTVWYKVELSLVDSLTTSPVIWAFFDHAWEDFEVKLPIKTAP